MLILLTIGLTGSLPGLSGAAAINRSPALGISPVANWTYASEQQGADFGFSVALAGDVDGDGFDDVVVGSPLYDLEADQDGAAFLFLGSASGLGSTPNWLVGSNQQGAAFGYALSTAGDVNGDGLDDLLVGAPEYKIDFGDNGTPPAGAAYVYHGSKDGLPSVPNWQTLAEARDIRYGHAVTGVGDVNGDGCDDVLVGAPNFSNAQTSEGKVYLYLGSKPDGLQPAPYWTYECNAANANCGRSVAAVGDFNQDGFDDFAVGAPYYDGVYLDEGQVLLFYGGKNGPGATPNLQWSGGQPGALFGASVAGIGDANGDGYDDLAIGATFFDGNSIDPVDDDLGAVHLYYGSTGTHTVIYGPQTWSNFGFAVSPAGDINGDNCADLLVGAYKYGEYGNEFEQPDEGAAYIYMGSPNGLQSAPSWFDFGDKAEAWFGYAVSTAGKVNDDPYVDIIVGAPNYKLDGKIVMGRAYSYYGIASSLPETYCTPPEEHMYRTYLPTMTK
jgi:hypothetical protein